MVRIVPILPKPQETINHKSVDVLLTEEQLTAIFRKHDKNGDGKLSREELKAAFQELRSRWPGFRTCQGFRHADANGDGFIDIKEELKALVAFALSCGYAVN